MGKPRKGSAKAPKQEVKDDADTGGWSGEWDGRAMICCDGYHDSELWVYCDENKISEEELSSITQFYCDDCINAPEVGEVQTVYAEGSTPRFVCASSSCTNKQRASSQYCSDKCGIKVASTRLQWLVAKHASMEHPASAADDVTNAEITKYEKERTRCADELQMLAGEHRKLARAIRRAEQMEEEAANHYGDDFQTDCVACGQMMSWRVMMKHSEKCFSKSESQYDEETRVPPDDLFDEKDEGIVCGHFTKKTGTYCNKLSIHCYNGIYKIKKLDHGGKACGYPVNSKEKIYCKMPKQECSKHYQWVKTWTASLHKRQRRLHQRQAKVELELTRKMHTQRNRASNVWRLLHPTSNAQKTT